MIWGILFQKLVWQKSTCWWRYNRPMWKEWHLFLDLVGMCVQNFSVITSCVHYLSDFVQNEPILQTLEANVSQLGWNMKYRTDLSWSHDYRGTVYWFAWFLEKISRNNRKKCVLHKSASRWRYKRQIWKSRAKVFPWPLGSAHTKLYTDQWSYR